MERIVKEKEKKKGVGKERRTDGRRKKKRNMREVQGKRKLVREESREKTREKRKKNSEERRGRKDREIEF